MYTASLKNDDLNITAELTGNEARWTTLKIDGLGPVSAQINTATAAGIDGVKFNSARLNARNIVITLRLNGDPEAARLELEQTFYPKAPVTFYYKNTDRDVCISGTVEALETDLFTASELMQISILCPDPFFHDVYQTFVSNWDGHPLEILTDTPFWTGVEMGGNFLVPCTSVRFENTSTGEFLQFDYPFEFGNSLTVYTHKGHKSAILRHGPSGRTNMIAYATPGSSFFSVRAGASKIKYSIQGVDPGQRDAFLGYVRFFNTYAGV